MLQLISINASSSVLLMIGSQGDVPGWRYWADKYGPRGANLVVRYQDGTTMPLTRA